MRILLIEDEAMIRLAMRSLLRGEGHKVVDVGDAESALDQYAEFSPDLVITDNGLPGMSGCELIAKIHQMNPVQRFIWCSGDPISDDLPNSQFISLMPKPFDINTLFSLLPIE